MCLLGEHGRLDRAVRLAEGRLSGVRSVDNLPSLCLGHLACQCTGRHR